MQVGSTPHTGALAGLRASWMSGAPSVGAQRGAPAPLLAAGDAHADALAQEQARFRIVGTGPVSTRDIVPVSDGARELLTASAAGTTEAVRGVLRLVEGAAGGPDASRGVQLAGIAFSDSQLGHGANTYRAHLDSDAEMVASLRPMSARQRSDALGQVVASTKAEAEATRANAVAGWINVGPDASGVLLAHQGLPLTGYSGSDQAGLALAVRVLRHEAQHAADTTRPDLPPEGVPGIREALAEANSTTTASLASARTALGLDGAVGDAALAATLAVRPYPAYERVLDAALRAAGMEPGGAAAAKLVAEPSRTATAQLVAGIARAEGTSVASARADVAREFAAARASQG